ncbi:MAG: MoxR family ATPase, partial [Clostridia bacterium]|nr:MoxR family ATPase [Clostridia bacterium]
LMKGRMEYPSHAENVGILARFDKASPLDELEAVVSEEELCEAIKALPEVYICPELMEYIAYIVEATRSYPHVVLGVSPRGALALMKAAKGYAAIAGRSYVLPDDIQRAAHPVLEHRIMLESAARIRKNAVGEIVENIIKSTRVPTEAVFENL